MLAAPKLQLPRRFSVYLEQPDREFLRELAAEDGSKNATIRRLIKEERERRRKAMAGKDADERCEGA